MHGGGGDKMEVTRTGCSVSVRGHEERLHSAEEKDTLMQKVSTIQLSVSSGSQQTHGQEGLLFRAMPHRAAQLQKTHKNPLLNPKKKSQPHISYLIDDSPQSLSALLLIDPHQ